MPHLKDLDQKIPSFANCDNYGIFKASNPNPLNDDTRTNDNVLHQQLCRTFKRLFAGNGYYYESEI